MRAIDIAAPRFGGRGAVTAIDIGLHELRVDEILTQLPASFGDVVVQLSGRRVFLASPGDLAPERIHVRAAIQRFNEEWAHANHVVFLPVGWEQIPSGAGRPQSLINPLLDACDFVILMLGERWGTPPSLSGEYSSGTEEEFEQTRRLLAAADAPMRNLMVLFKTLDSSRMRAPDEQLQKVLEFRARLEAGRTVLFETFDSMETLGRSIEKGLRQWMQPLGEKIPVELTLGEIDVGVAMETEGSVDDLLARASANAERGQLLQAEMLYATAVEGREPRALSEFAKFMRRTGRLQSAFELTQEILSTPAVLASTDAGSVGLRVQALANMGVIQRKNGRLVESVELLEEAVSTAEEFDMTDVSDLTYALDNLGISLEKLGRVEQARAHVERALHLRKDLASESELAQSLVNVGRNALARKDVQAAREAFDSARSLLNQSREPLILANALAGRAKTAIIEADTQYAIEMFEQALELNRRVKNSDGISIVAGQLARLRLQIGDVAAARLLGEEVARESERSGNRTGEATANWILGLVAKAENDNQAAEVRAKQALDAAQASSVVGLEHAIVTSLSS